MKPKIDLEATESEHKGIKGLFDVLLRRFRNLMHFIIMIPIYLFLCLILGTALTPALLFGKFISGLIVNENTLLQSFVYGVTLAMGYFIYGFSMLALSPLVNFFLGRGLKEGRGPYYSIESLKWFMHNGLTYIVRFTFLEFVTPSPFNILFYRMMGMQIGRGTMINSTWISDPSLIELGEKVTIGGSVTLVAHYGQGGLLIIAPVKIGDQCTIGLKATIMGGAVLGRGVKILPHSVVLPKTIIPDGETWGGVPAQKIAKDSSPLRIIKVA